MATARAILSRAEAAEYVQSYDLPLASYKLQAASCKLQKYATTGGGPRYHKFGQRCVYRREDLDAWIATKLGRPVTSSSDTARAADGPDPEGFPEFGANPRDPAAVRDAAGRRHRMSSRRPRLADLTAQALGALKAAGLDFGDLGLDARFRRKPSHDHPWYVADTGVGRGGQPSLMVTAGNAKVTGDVSTPLVVYKSWAMGGAAIDPAEAAGIQRQIAQTTRRRREEDKAQHDTAAQQARALWFSASGEVNGHPYLSAKGIKAHGIQVRELRTSTTWPERKGSRRSGRSLSGSPARSPSAPWPASSWRRPRCRRRRRPGPRQDQPGAGRGRVYYDLEPPELPGHPGVHTTWILWGAPLEGSARELLGKAESVDDPDEHSALQEAKDFLAGLLANGPLPAKKIKREAHEAGHANRTLKRAKAALGIRARKAGMRDPWLWHASPLFTESSSERSAVR